MTTIITQRARWKPAFSLRRPVLMNLLLGLLWTTLARAEQPAPLQNRLPLLTRVEQIRRLSPDKAARGYPVRLRAVVTYYGGQGWELFIQDSTKGIYVNIGDAEFPIQAGQRVEVEGISYPGLFAPEIRNPRFRVLGQAPLPKARRVSFEELVTGIEDGQWMEVNGIVRSATEEEGRLILDLAVGSGRIKAFTPNYRRTDLLRLVDAKVRVRSACGTSFNQKGQLLGVELYVPSVAEILVQEPALPDPFFTPLRPINTLLRFTPHGASNHRVRVQGVVTLQREQHLFISDATDSLYIQALQTPALRPGDRIEALGFPAIGGYTPVWQDAVVRKTGFDKCLLHL